MTSVATFSAAVDSEALLEQARRETGLSDFGDSGFLPSLDRFTKMMERSTAAASDKVAGFGQVVDVLATRLRLVEDAKRFPGIIDERIESPLIVIGFPRCGTTLLHALLTECPGNRAPLWWEVSQPSPPPALAEVGDPRLGWANRQMERWLADYPGFLAQHPYHDYGGLVSMECEALMAYDLRNSYPMLMSKVPFGEPWIGSDDQRATYAAHHRVLQQLQFGAPRRRWVLKGVEHQYRLGALLEQYPDAMLVWPHRDPAQVFGSLLSVSFEVAKFSGADISDPRAFSERILQGYVDRVDVAIKDPHTVSDRVCHVQYADFSTDQVATIDKIYDHFDLDSTGNERAVRAWLDDPGNRADRHGKWTYDLADFGLTADEIRERFGRYVDHYGVVTG